MSRDNDISRRKVLKSSGAILGASTGLGTAGIGAFGVASAAATCEGNDVNAQEKDYVWGRDPYTADTHRGTCSDEERAIKVGNKFLYLGSAKDNGYWSHDFVTVGHAESLADSNCGGLQRDGKLNRHQARFVNNDTDDTTIYPMEGDKVKASPKPSDNQSTGENMDYFFTALSLYLSSTPGGWVSAPAVSILGAMYDDNNTSNEITYSWTDDYNEFWSCGSHGVFQQVEADTKDYQPVDFRVYDEGWRKYGYSELYAGLYWDIQFEVATPTSGTIQPSDEEITEIESTDGRSIDTFDTMEVPTEGSVISTENGSEIEVTSVESKTERKSGTPEREMKAKNLPSPSRKQYDPEQQVTFRGFPARITTHLISGVEK